MSETEKTQLYCSVYGGELERLGNLVYPCSALIEAARELASLRIFLDGINVKPANLTVQRVESVVRHYATQLGQWVKAGSFCRLK